MATVERVSDPLLRSLLREENNGSETRSTGRSTTAMLEYPLEEIAVEDNEDFVSLSLGFVSPEDPLDTLHIVCGKIFTDTAPPQIEERLYLERTDQSQSIEGGVVSIYCNERTIAFEITIEAQIALGLPAKFSLRFACADIERQRAMSTLKSMAILNRNDDIRFDDC